jgi:hypothetical protein
MDQNGPTLQLIESQNLSPSDEDMMLQQSTLAAAKRVVRRMECGGPVSNEGKPTETKPQSPWRRPISWVWEVLKVEHWLFGGVNGGFNTPRFLTFAEKLWRDLFYVGLFAIGGSKWNTNFHGGKLREIGK